MTGYPQKRDWPLVLDARAIPFCVASFNGQEHIYTPALYAGLARGELSAFAAEGRRGSKKFYHVYPHAWLAPLFLLPLILLHGLIAGWWPSPGFLPPASSWTQLGCLDAAALKFHDQWYRIFTAMTLHADLRHLSDNLFFGAIFLFFLGRIAGWGMALLLSVLGGALANAASVAFHVAAYKSIGFSTALFACVGAMAGVMFHNPPDRQKMLMPLGAAAALLALLGTEGDNTDYGAHIAGLFSGVMAGMMAGFTGCKASQKLYGIAAFSLPFLAWFFAWGLI